MWNKNRSLMLSIVLSIIILVVLTAAVFFAPFAVQWYADTMERPDIPRTAVLAFFYSCVPFAYIALGVLLKLLFNIRKEQVFTRVNVTLLRILSWCCFAVAAACLVGGFFYLPFFIICVPAVFIALILRVIKSVLNQGTDIKDDNDLTI